ncbi:MAG: tetratricopeptide repeat protein, partial [Chloroflexi bacterium]|nr:tetratricopeptide repeat protein [Chloroflexota bacterium]
THNNLGNALYALRRHDEAMAHFLAALALDPLHREAHYNLANALLSLQRLDEAEAEYRKALEIDPDNPPIHQGLAILLLMRGKVVEAAPYGKVGFHGGVEPRPFRGKGRAPRVLVLESALGGNVRTDGWLDDAAFRSAVITIEFLESGKLPPHDLIVNAISDADRCTEALLLAEKLITGSPKAAINPPRQVLATGRLHSAARLSQLEGVRTPRVATFARADLSADVLARDGFGWPLLLRALGYHTGEYFVKVDAPADLAGAAAGLPGESLLAIEFVNLFGADGKTRKFRVMAIDGRLYPLHLAVSHHWMVHFITADMGDNAEHRAEDAAFLADMPGVLGPRAMAALERISDAVRLDFGGMDFALDADGQVVLFEANASMVMPRPDGDDERWAYRTAPVQRVYDAVRVMLDNRVAAGRRH